MTIAESGQPGLETVTVTRSHRGFEVCWQREGRPTSRQLSDLGSAFHLAYQVAGLRDLPVIDLTGGSR
jgi:hypothetical protein